ncbi:hypothetical protein AVEN_102346-1 [Araneus ventricosus]|uniref:Uncharacterized protein n=1 Tax=Araneus ventricosus TaxID=182803 RepID=A0A4Y2QSB0_ARAVE|nr:hypothetical protein AVEN_102346-1 [Araneus ventricosus]
MICRAQAHIHGESEIWFRAGNPPVPKPRPYHLEARATRQFHKAFYPACERFSIDSMNSNHNITTIHSFSPGTGVDESSQKCLKHP